MTDIAINQNKAYQTKQNKNLRSKDFGSEKCLGKKTRLINLGNWSETKLWVPKNIWSKNIWVPLNFWSKKIFVFVKYGGKRQILKCSKRRLCQLRTTIEGCDL